MFAGNNDVDIVAAADTVVKAAQQAVGIRRQIQADDVGLLVGDVIHEAGILVGEAVVILLPDRGAHDQVQRGDLLTPGQLIADLEPLGVLCGHGVDDAGEGLIGGKETMAAGKQIALKPAFAHMLGEH